MAGNIRSQLIFDITKPPIGEVEIPLNRRMFEPIKEVPELESLATQFPEGRGPISVTFTPRSQEGYLASEHETTINALHPGSSESVQLTVMGNEVSGILHHRQRTIEG